eukprot:2404264-Prymnesium_polylepis.1
MEQQPASPASPASPARHTRRRSARVCHLPSPPRPFCHRAPLPAGAQATLGVIHKGHIKQARQLLAPYLPQAGMSASPFSEGGALYALGIIHANHGADIRSYLLDALRNAGTNETVQHGAALGIGIAAMATEDDELYEELK